MKNCLPAIYLSLLTFHLHSQQYVDILKLTAGSTSLNQFDSSGSKTRIQEINADLTIPIKLNDRAAIISGLIFENYQLKLFPDHGIRSLGALTLKLGLKRDFNARWAGTLVFLPKISSDQIAFTSKDLQFGGLGLMKYQKHGQLNYKFGLYYNSELFGPFFVPVFGTYYLSPDKKFEANIMLPLNVDLNYQWHRFLNSGLAFNGQIRSYHLSHVIPAYADTYLSRSTNEIFAYLRFNFSRNLMLQIRGGQSFARKYRVYDFDDKVDFGLPLLFFGGNRKQLNSDFSDGWIFQGTLIYRVNFQK